MKTLSNWCTNSPARHSRRKHTSQQSGSSGLIRKHLNLVMINSRQTEIFPSELSERALLFPHILSDFSLKSWLEENKSFHVDLSLKMKLDKHTNGRILLSARREDAVLSSSASINLHFRKQQKAHNFQIFPLVNLIYFIYVHVKVEANYLRHR